MTNRGDLVRRGEAQVAAPSTEQTRPGPVFTPAVDIFETENELVVLADMPGVSSDGLNISLENDLLTIEGVVDDQTKPQEKILLQEYLLGRYWRQFTLGEAVDRDKIEATMTNGRLRLVLPKSEAAKPRKIEVKAA